MAKPGSSTPALITRNRKARHHYSIEETLEAGIALQGWEVKSLRAGRIQLDGSYILLKDGQAFLFGALITPLPAASSHAAPEPARNRPLLLHRRELARLVGMVERKGRTIAPLRLYWRRGKIKLEIGVAKGKKQHDKRAAEKERDWRRQRARLLAARGRKAGGASG